MPESAPTQVMAQQGLVTRSQLALELGVSEQLLALWEKDGLPVLGIGMQRMYDAKLVAGWIRKNGKKKKK